MGNEKRKRNIRKMKINNKYMKNEMYSYFSCCKIVSEREREMERKIEGEGSGREGESERDNKRERKRYFLTCRVADDIIDLTNLI